LFTPLANSFLPLDNRIRPPVFAVLIMQYNNATTMKSLNLILFACIFSLLGVTACSKKGGTTGGGNTNNPPPPPPPVGNKDVYVAGYEISSSGKNVAKYWKNDTAVNLTNGTRDAVATSIFVAGSDVYVAGYQDKPASVLNIATYWKNGTAYPLSITGTGGPFDVANSIFVAGDDVYAAGLERAANGNDVAKYWKNSTPVNLTDGSKDADAQSIFVSGSDIYVAGSEAKSVTSTKNIAKVWKNGVAIPLTDGSTNANAMAVVVVGTDVYVAGTVDDTAGFAKAAYWKNGVQTTMSTGSQNSYGFAMAVSGSDVFVGGRNGNVTIVSGYWKNSFASFTSLLPAPSYEAGEETVGGIVVSGTDIYAAGNYKIGGKFQPVYWKNGTAKSLSNSGFNSSATGIFIK
jgi:hypothetical protein